MLEVAAPDPLAGLTLVSPETHGRYSPLEQMALRAREKWGSVSGAFERLGSEDTEILTAFYDPVFTLRPVQCVPSVTLGRNWKTYMFAGGRGAGKTHSGACAVIEEAMQDPEARILIVGPTYTEIQKNQLKAQAASSRSPRPGSNRSTARTTSSSSSPTAWWPTTSPLRTRTNFVAMATPLSGWTRWWPGSATLWRSTRSASVLAAASPRACAPWACRVVASSHHLGGRATSNVLGDVTTGRSRIHLTGEVVRKRPICRLA
jgi:hypothetical protein